MKNMSKQTIILLISCAVLAVILVGLLIFAFTRGDSNTPDPTDPTDQIGTQTDPTGDQPVDGTLPDGTNPGTSTLPPDSTEPEILPSVSLGIVDRDEFENNENPTEPTRPQNPTDPVTPTQPVTPTTPTTEPTEPTEPPTMPEVEGITLLTWEEYMALSGAEQRAYKESFPNREDYYAWLEAAKAAYKEQHESEFDGNLDFGNLGGN